MWKRSTWPGDSQHRLTSAEAMFEGVAAELDPDPSVLYLGEEVGADGGILGSTRALLDRFAPERILDTPISEPAYLGRPSAPRSRGCGRSLAEICRSHAGVSA